MTEPKLLPVQPEDRSRLSEFGAMFEHEGAAFLVWKGTIHGWSFDGYGLLSSRTMVS